VIRYRMSNVSEKDTGSCMLRKMWMICGRWGITRLYNEVVGLVVHTAPIHLLTSAKESKLRMASLMSLVQSYPINQSNAEV